MRRTLSTLGQLGLANASALTVHFNHTIQPLAEELIIELVDETIKKSYLELIEAVEKRTPTDPDSLSKFGSTLLSITAESKDREEFQYLMHMQLRVYRLWRTQEPDPPAESNEQLVEDGSYRMVAAEIAGAKTRDWADSSSTKLPMADCSDLAQTLYHALKDGTYFSEELYDREVEMSPGGSLRLVGKKDIHTVEEDWPEDLFEGPIH